VADLLAHRAGLAWIDGTMSVQDMLGWDPVVKALERQKPSWPRGRPTAITPHYGWLVGEVVRRVSGRSIGTICATRSPAPGGRLLHRPPPVGGTPGGRLVPMLSGGTSGPPTEGTGTGGGAVGRRRDRPGRLVELDPSYLAPDGLVEGAHGPGGALADPELWQSPRLHRPRFPPPTAYAIPVPGRLYGACVSDVRTGSGSAFRILTPEEVDRAVSQTNRTGHGALAWTSSGGLGFNVNRGLIAAAGLGGPRSFGHFRHGRIRRSGPTRTPSWPWAT